MVYHKVKSVTRARSEFTSVWYIVDIRCKILRSINLCLIRHGINGITLRHEAKHDDGEKGREWAKVFRVSIEKNLKKNKIKFAPKSINPRCPASISRRLFLHILLLFFVVSFSFLHRQWVWIRGGAKKICHLFEKCLAIPVETLQV